MTKEMNKYAIEVVFDGESEAIKSEDTFWASKDAAYIAAQVAWQADGGTRGECKCIVKVTDLGSGAVEFFSVGIEPRLDVDVEKTDAAEAIAELAQWAQQEACFEERMASALEPAAAERG